VSGSGGNEAERGFTNNFRGMRQSLYRTFNRDWLFTWSLLIHP